MLRLAAYLDVPVIIELAKEFFNLSPYKDTAFDETGVEKLITGLIDARGEQGVVILSTDKENRPTGFLVALLTKIPWNGQLLATELGWYSKGREGVKLFDAFEYWAKNVAEADSIQTGLISEKTSKFYKRRGYLKHDETWIKRWH